MKLIRGTLRLTCFILLLMLTTLLVLLTAWIPVRIKGARLSAWFLPTVCRLLLPLFNVEFTVREADRITRHDGFIFPNHLSFLDIILLLSIFPVRFLAKSEIAYWPFVGWIARAVDTVFVKREDKESREKARDALAQLHTFPAVAIFPEGVEAEAGLQSLFAPTPTPTPETVIYVVQRGDTLYSIARRYGATVDAVKAANGLTSNNISPGQQLIIP